LSFTSRQLLGCLPGLGAVGLAGRQLITTDATAGVNPDVSVFVDEVSTAYEAAVSADVEIVRPLTSEEWGVTRFSPGTPPGGS
jgi:hypothetical protein